MKLKVKEFNNFCFREDLRVWNKWYRMAWDLGNRVDRGPFSKPGAQAGDEWQRVIVEDRRDTSQSLFSDWWSKLTELPHVDSDIYCLAVGSSSSSASPANPACGRLLRAKSSKEVSPVEAAESVVDGSVSGGPLAQSLVDVYGLACSIRASTRKRCSFGGDVDTFTLQLRHTRDVALLYSF
ncbi:hypothetical protein RB195_001300 [Necator americanus]|uniref:Uncharacterized protein n=1 Tax=Necator americanus TaxID=51031 RepID=A0ABR1DEH0_NECAM